MYLFEGGYYIISSLPPLTSRPHRNCAQTANEKKKMKYVSHYCNKNGQFIPYTYIRMYSFNFFCSVFSSTLFWPCFTRVYWTDQLVWVNLRWWWTENKFDANGWFRTLFLKILDEFFPATVEYFSAIQRFRWFETVWNKNFVGIFYI